MIIKIHNGRARGKIQAPPSKSVSHRYLIAAALAEGKSVIKGLAFSQDILATLDCLNSLGINCEISGDTVTVYGGSSF